ncbi:MAG: hypothetical protein JW971_02045 [Synergistales bacterium]|nr:hypothetical protein [Synergistales bacterium]
MRSVLPSIILYSCAVAMFFLGLRRLRAGQPFRGVINMAFAAVIAIMGWYL